jgi:glutaredoxin
MKKLYFYKGKDCPKCPVVRQMLDEMIEELNGDNFFDVVEIYMDDEEGYLTAMMNQVRSAPTLIIDGHICRKVEEMREFVLDHRKT